MVAGEGWRQRAAGGAVGGLRRRRLSLKRWEAIQHTMRESERRRQEAGLSWRDRRSRMCQ